MKFVFGVFFICSCVSVSLAQIGGENVYDFLTIPNSARLGSLGGNQVGIFGNDLNMQFHNPAMIGDSVHNNLVINYVPMPADIRYGYVGYARNIKNIGTLALGIHNFNGGTIIGHDEFDNEIGQINSAEYAFLLTYTKRLSKNIVGGITFKPVLSQFWHYNSFALLSDIGFAYHDNNRLFSAGVVLKSFGSQISSFDEAPESVPTDLQIGLSNKLAHAPFRFSLTLQGLLNWDLEYEVDKSENGSANNHDESNSISHFNNVMRHAVFGVEFLPFKNFYIAAGYNHRVRQELKLEDRASTVGYSWGFGFRVYKFHVSYGSGRYHLASSSNFFSLTTNLSKFGF
ncbi:MAG: type IX secretion system protein PorQ [Marinilabiliaceae bacterium]|nr:type IX secretion system protein PorQ [Marinilabiliaceae bacterium]